MVKPRDRLILAFANFIIGLILFPLVPALGAFLVGVALLIVATQFKRQLKELIFG